MSSTVLIQFILLAVIVAVGLCVAYFTFEMRNVCADQRIKFVKAITAVETLVQHLRSDGEALQQIAMQIEAAVASLEKTISGTVRDAATQHRGIIEELRDHIDWSEQQFADLVKDAQETRSAAAEVRDESAHDNGNGHYALLRKEFAGADPELRFSALNDWVNTNYLSFLRRASRGWMSPADLITHIPSCFEAQAEISSDDYLLIGTRGYPEKVAVRLNDSELDTDESHFGRETLKLG